MPARRWAALAVGLGAALAACSMGSPKRLPSAPPPGGDDPRQQITARWNQIRQLRLDAHLDGEPDPDQVAAMSDVPAIAAANACEAPAPTAGTCGDVCELGDAICDNALAICQLADELDGDAWAKGKCDSAKASCHQAEDRCCACQRPTLGTP